jgi:hypothetical protein
LIKEPAADRRTHRNQPQAARIISVARSAPPGTMSNPRNAGTASKPYTTGEPPSIGERATAVGDESL